MLNPGTYKLTSDVTNPKADKRKKGDWTARPKFEAGEIIVVIGSRGDRAATIKCVGENHHDRFSTLDERATALEPHLQPIEETIGAMFLRLDVYSWHLPQFLRYLIESGAMTKADFEKHLETWLNQPEAE